MMVWALDDHLLQDLLRLGGVVSTEWIAAVRAGVVVSLFTVSLIVESSHQIVFRNNILKRRVSLCAFKPGSSLPGGWVPWHQAEPFTIDLSAVQFWRELIHFILVSEIPVSAQALPQPSSKFGNIYFAGWIAFVELFWYSTNKSVNCLFQKTKTKTEWRFTFESPLFSHLRLLRYMAWGNGLLNDK